MNVKNTAASVTAILLLIVMMITSIVSCAVVPGTETDAPTDPVTDAPTDPITDAPTEPVTDAPTEPVTDAPTDPITDAPTEPVTDAPTDPITDAPTEPVTDAPTEPVTAPVTDPPVTKPPVTAPPETEPPEPEAQEIPFGTDTGPVVGTNFPSIDISEYMSGYLHITINVADGSTSGSGQIELSSDGRCDSEEISVATNDFLNFTGKRNITIPMSEFSPSGSGDFNPKELNFIRIYTGNGGGSQITILRVAINNKETFPAPPPETEPVPVTEEVVRTEVKETVYAIYNVYLRSSWESNAIKYTILNSGQSITRIAIYENGWSGLSYNGGEVFVKTEYLTITEPSETAPVTPETEFTYQINPLFATYGLNRYPEVPVEPGDFHGASSPIVGKSGFLFEPTYIDEYLGYSAPYTSTSYTGLKQNITKLTYIQSELNRRGIAFVYVITPSKASNASKYIPDWYKESHTTADNYVRPIETYRKLLEKSTLYYVDSTKLYEKIGLVNSFTKTGIHWNRIASMETTKEIQRLFRLQSDIEPYILKYDDIIASDTALNSTDMDIYSILYNHFPDMLASSVTDNKYYYPDIKIANPDTGSKIGVFVQGGSFCWDFKYYFCDLAVNDIGLCDTYRQYYYNEHWIENGEWINNAADRQHDVLTPGGIYNWEYLLENIDLVILEQTEQQIRSGQTNYTGLSTARYDGSIGSNAVYESLRRYLYVTATD